MLTFAHVWIFTLLPLPWLVRAILPPRRTERVAVRVPFGDRLRAATAEGGSVSRVTKQASRQIVPTLVWLLVLQQA